MCQLYGVAYTGKPLPQNLWFSLMLEEDREQAGLASSRYLEGHTDAALLVRVPLADGSLRYVRSVGQLQTGRDGSRKLIGLAFDVTKDELMNAELKSAKQESDAKNAELELAKSRIEHNSLHDPLTLLSNRRKLDMELDRVSRASHETRQKFSILHLDLDRFKQINDTLGHAAGDAMLIHASRILSRNVRSEDIVARIGGDEFVILVPGSSTEEELAQLSQRIIGEFRQPLDFEGLSCRCGVSIGIAQASGMKIDARRILVNADIALYRAKGQGRNCYQFFTQNLQAEIISQRRTADEVLSAIDNDEFVTWYQPQFSARTGKLTGVEALIRWNHPHHGILAPDRFLRIAEDLNVTAVLDQTVLETVLKDKMRWTAMGLDIPKVSVNVSAKRLHDEALVETLQTLPITPGEISFELVESIFLDDGDDLISGNLERIKALGIDIEIDDFGTGHTSIVSLLKLKPKRLKIDRQLVMPILHSPQERALVRSIIDIARSLGVDTVAEGVETMQHASILRDLGCDLLQGYAFSRPLPFDRFVEAAAKDWKQEAA
jgi:diguanylate cyclase (GGDEF)-like protein